MKQPIYLDYNATTPLDPKVFAVMKPFFEDQFGNASSNSHSYGWQANMAVEKARKQVAELIGADKKEIFFTSGATESNNLAIQGLVRGLRGKKIHIITAQTEHKAVLEVCEFMSELENVEVTYLPVNQYGQVSAEQVEQAIQDNTRLISLMMANNEIGTFHPIAEIGQVAKKHKIVFHTDAAQAAGKCEIDVNKLNIDLLSISGHKMYGPKGVGALYVRQCPNLTLERLQCGGSQERELRPGTLNVPGIVGLGQACSLASELMESEHQRLTDLRQHLIDSILKQVPEAQLNGHPEQRLAGNASLSFKGLSSDLFALGLSGLALSSGSACTSASGSPSHVLKAIGLSDDLAQATIRLGMGRFTTREEVDTAIAKILRMTQKSQEISVS